jgi:LysM repeat protein
MRTYTPKQRALYIRRRVAIRLLALLLFIGLSATSGVMLHANAMDEDTIVEGTAAGSQNAEADSQPLKKSSLLSVEPGDTLWNIARTYGPEGVSAKKYVQQIMERNQLESANLQVGQVLQLP